MQAPRSQKSWLELLNSTPPSNYVAGLSRGATHFTTQPNIGPARAPPRFEVTAGTIQFARDLIQKGCQLCPKNMDVRIEACRLANPDEAKCPDPELDVKLLLQRAVECCPLHLQLWLTLAGLETYDTAKNVLNEARKMLPKEPAIWIAAAKLEEENGGKTQRVEKILEKGIQMLHRERVQIDRKAWLNEAEAAERAGFLLTGYAIIRNIIGIGAEGEDRKATWIADANECLKRGSIETFRAIYVENQSFDEYKVNDATLFTSSEYDEADKEADAVWEEIDKRMDSRRKERHEARLKEDIKKYRASNLTITEQFADLKSELVTLSTAEWDSIPEIADSSWRNKRRCESVPCHENIPSSVSLWKEAVVSANEEDVKLVLQGAVERCPMFVPFWLTLASLETYEAAKIVLNKGKTNLPKEPAIWIAEAKLEEANGNTAMVREIIEQGIWALQTEGVVVDGEAWLKEVEVAERAGLVNETICNKIGIGVEEGLH